MKFLLSDGWEARSQSSMPFQTWKPSFVSDPDTLCEVCVSEDDIPKVARYGDLWWGWSQNEPESVIRYARLGKTQFQPVVSCGTPGSAWVQFTEMHTEKAVTLNRHHISTVERPPYESPGTVVTMNNGRQYTFTQPYIVVRRILKQMENVGGRED